MLARSKNIHFYLNEHAFIAVCLTLKVQMDFETTLGLVLQDNKSYNFIFS